jgi:Pup amidohydrolase
VIWDKAGERVLELAAAGRPEAPGSRRGDPDHKNNTDGKGAAYGTHENYLIDRQTPFGELVRHLTPFFVSRQVFVGSGRVGIGSELGRRASSCPSAPTSSRSRSVSRPRSSGRSSTPATSRTPTRRSTAGCTSSSATRTWRGRTYLKVGSTALVLSMIEDGWLREAGIDLSVDGPVSALRAVSHDPTLTQQVLLRDGRRMTAVQVQMEYLEQARKHVEDRLGTDVDAQTADVLDRWESVLLRLTTDRDSLAGELDWVAKLQLLEGYREREGLSWDAPKLHLVDLQYSDVRQDRGLYNRLAARGRMQRLVTDAEVQWALDHPPADTRAYFRGRCLAQFPGEVAAASWDSVIFDVGRESLQRVPTLEPLRGTKAHVEGLLDSCETAAELVEALTNRR